MRAFVVAALLMVLLAPSAAFAGTTGSLVGTVKDASSGAPVSGATVIVQSPAEREQTTTDAKGGFTFVSLMPNTYTVFVSTRGYGTTVIPNVAVEADVTHDLPIALRHYKIVAHLFDCPAPSILTCTYIAAHQTYEVYVVSPRTPFYSFDGRDIYALHFIPGLTFGAGPVLSR
jgi:hypothetical protein